MEIDMKIDYESPKKPPIEYMNSRNEKCKIAYDQNAEDAIRHAAEDAYSRSWRYASEERRGEIVKYFLHNAHISHICEEGDFKRAVEQGLFCCSAGYVFNTVVEEGKTYRLYRCDGGHHYGIAFKEFKHQDGSTGNERRFVIKNGELVEALDTTVSNNQMEID